MIRVAISEDHPQVRVALRLLLSQSNGIELISETENGQEAVDCVKVLQPDVLVMAIHLPVLDGFEATKQITRLQVSTRVILISVDIGSFIAMQAADVGARGFIPKDNLAQQLLPAIEAVQQGETFFVES
ncbi:MAG TPA: response regulator transcription factor [Anaerolineales bacterium]|nr:response regulator transcription factor [Anaerolineales bacterium]